MVALQEEKPNGKPRKLFDANMRLSEVRSIGVYRVTHIGGRPTTTGAIMSATIQEPASYVWVIVQDNLSDPMYTKPDEVLEGMSGLGPGPGSADLIKTLDSEGKIFCVCNDEDNSDLVGRIVGVCDDAKLIELMNEEFGRNFLAHQGLDCGPGEVVFTKVEYLSELPAYGGVDWYTAGMME
jgi:hypothetical protein|tara:strand:+ start:191 stop:733 length:543 start_codon:yes stop_codon:yes gene_type:complete